MERAADVQLAAGELVTNVLKHSGAGEGAIAGQVCLGHVPDGVVLRVCNPQPHGLLLPAARQPEPEAESGRGLMLVHAVADAWGTSIGNGVVTVWAYFVRGGAR